MLLLTLKLRLLVPLLLLKELFLPVLELLLLLPLKLACQKCLLFRWHLRVLFEKVVCELKALVSFSRELLTSWPERW